MHSDNAMEFPSYLVSGLDSSELEAICRSAVKATRQKLKFGDLQKEMTRAWKTAKDLGLDVSPPLDILDLGLGPGYFLYVCQKLSHRVVGLDRPDLPVWPEIRKWLGVKTIIEHTIGANRALPKMGRRFDLVTAFACPFHYVESQHRLWTIDEWNFFFDDVRDRILKPNRRLALILRKQIRGLQPTTDEAKLFDELCRDRGLSGIGEMRVFDPLR
jgi:SAM-dependent methyltransferase